jgi:hypothetical protein
MHYLQVNKGQKAAAKRAWGGFVISAIQEVMVIAFLFAKRTTE